MYIQRYIRHFPAAGEVVIFDRSWYNRAGVKRVMGFCTEEQTRRLTARIDDPRKIWKLSPMDLKSYDLWDEYTKARDEMFAKTDVPWAPWNFTYSNDKKRAPLNIISHLLSSVKYKKLNIEKVKLPKRKIGKGDEEKNSLFKLIPEKF